MYDTLVSNVVGNPRLKDELKGIDIVVPSKKKKKKERHNRELDAWFASQTFDDAILEAKLDMVD